MKKVAVVGCGRMGAFSSESVLQFAPASWFPLSHAEAVRAHPELELIALADINTESLRKAANYYGIKSRYKDLEVLLDTHKIDLLCLATRTPGRANMIKTANSAGVKAIHAEKPLCNTVQELDILEKIFQQEDFFFTWGAIRRYLPAYRQALSWAESGDLGRLLEVRINFGSSTLYWTHAHAFDLLNFGAGKRPLKSINAKFGNHIKNEKNSLSIQTDPIVEYCVAEFEDGVQGYITQSPGSDFILTCEKGEISVVADGANLFIKTYNGKSYPVTSEVPITERNSKGGTLIPISMLTACLNRDEIQISENKKIKKDIIQAQKMMFAATYSDIENGRKVKSNELLPNIEIWAISNNSYA